MKLAELFKHAFNAQVSIKKCSFTIILMNKQRRKDRQIDIKVSMASWIMIQRNASRCDYMVTWCEVLYLLYNTQLHPDPIIKVTDQIANSVIWKLCMHQIARSVAEFDHGKLVPIIAPSTPSRTMKTIDLFIRLWNKWTLMEEAQQTIETARATEFFALNPSFSIILEMNWQCITELGVGQFPNR